MQPAPRRLPVYCSFTRGIAAVVPGIFTAVVGLTEAFGAAQGQVFGRASAIFSACGKLLA